MLTCVTRLLLCYQTDRFDRSIGMPQLISSSEIQGQIEQNKASNAPTCPFTALQSPHIVVAGARLISQFIQSFQGVADLQYQASSRSIASHRMSSTKQEQRATLTYLPAPFLLLAISLSLPPDRVRRQASPLAVARAPGSGKIPAFPPESETTRSRAQKR